MKKKLPKIKKEIKNFLRSEEGKMSKEEIAELGTAIAALGFFVSGNSSIGHSSYFESESESEILFADSSPQPQALYAHSSHYSGASDDCHSSHSSHSSHGSHGSHGNHGNHSSHTNHGNHASHTNHGNHASHTNHGNHSSHTNHGNHASHTSCPFLVVWGDSGFSLENNILPQAEKSSGEDVKDIYKIENKPVADNGFYKLGVVEFEREKSKFKNFKLVRVMHSKDVKIAVLDGEIIGYKNLTPPDEIKINGTLTDQQTIKQNKGDFAEIIFNKKRLTEKKKFFVSETALRAGERRIDKVDQSFNEVFDEKDLAKKVILATFLTMAFTASGALAQSGTMKHSIYHYQYTEDGEEKSLGITHPREKMSTKIVDFSDADYQNNLRIKLEWTTTHKIRPLGLAETVSPEELEIEFISPEKINHSEKGKLTLKEIKGDSVELTPGEMLTLDFPAKEKNKEEETFLFVSEGYYQKL